MSERTCAFSRNSPVRFLFASFVAVVLTGFVADVEAQEENTQSGVSAEVDPAGTRDLVTASRTGDLEAILDCVREFGINEPDSNHGVTPLSWAAAMGHADAVDLLLREGADINARNRDGATALHAASFFGHPEAAERLISQGADVNAETHDGARPLDVITADWEVTREIAELLDIDLDEENVAAGRAKVSELLRQRGAEQGGNTLVVLSIVFGCIAGGLAIAGVIIWVEYHFEKKRTEAMKAVAAEIGLHFSMTKDESLLAKLQSFSLFNKGHGRKMKNVMKAETEIAQLTIFDYRYKTGYGKHSHTHHHTVVALESGSLRIPEFTLRPEGLFDKIGSTLGFQDIDFKGHPEFSRMFVLKGKNEAAIRGYFDAEMLSMFTQRKGATIDSGPGVFIYLRGGRKNPEEIQGFMTEGFGVYKAFQQRLQTSQSSPPV